MLNDVVIEAIVKIGNQPNFVKMVEPDIFCPLELQKWMVRRTLMVLELFEDELHKDTRSPISETSIPSEGAVHSDS